MISGIDHINIVVRDLKKSLDFYCRILGFREMRRAHLEGDWIDKVTGLKGLSADVVFIIAPGGEPRIELLQYQHPVGQKLEAASLPNTPGLRHMAFRVKNIAEATAALRAEGVKVLNDPATVPGDVIKHDAGSKKLCYFLDPDGVLLELAEYL